MHDFHHIAFGERMFGMTAARDDLAIDLHRDPAFGQPLMGQELDDGRSRLRQSERLAVESNLHRRIVALSGPIAQVYGVRGHRKLRKKS